MENIERIERNDRLERINRYQQRRQIQDRDEEQQLVQQQRLVPDKLPVLVFPPALTFYTDDQSNHKQILTIYNLYDFAVKFRVFCTVPDRYNVVDPEGKIKPKTCVDIVIRHIEPTPGNCGGVDKFRIQLQEQLTRGVHIIGKTVIESRLIAGRKPPEVDRFERLPASDARRELSMYDNGPPQSREINGDNNVIALTVGAICIIGLLMPSEGDSRSVLPQYLHLAHSFKNILCFLLGMITYMLLRR